MPILLLADDSITVQRVIGLTFAAEDIQIVTVSDGQAAIDLIRSEPPDIVLAGSAMPHVNGYDVASFVRSQPALNALPVLLLTGAFETVDAERLKTSGANGVLEKPLDPTVVIGRVKDLLGIRGAARLSPAPARTAASNQMPIDRQPPAQREAPASSQARHGEPPPVRAAQTSNWDELRESTGLAPDAGSVEGEKNETGGDDYLDTLDAAFDSLDQRLAGRDPRQVERRQRDRRKGPPRNPGPPNSASPLVRHAAAAAPPVPARAAARTASALSPTYEVDDAWFAGDEKDQDQQLIEQKVLAAEMGIRDIETPDDSGAAEADAPNADLDFEFGPDGEPKPVAPPAPPPAPVHAPSVRMPGAVAPMPPRSDAPPVRGVADDFAALLAFEQGEHPHPPASAFEEPPAAPVIVQAAAPEITDAMLDQIATRVADRLNADLLGDQLRDAMTTTIRDTVRAVVSETSERLVRDEIARVKAQAERDTT